MCRENLQYYTLPRKHFFRDDPLRNLAVKHDKKMLYPPHLPLSGVRSGPRAQAPVATAACSAITTGAVVKLTHDTKLERGSVVNFSPIRRRIKKKDNIYGVRFGKT